MNKTTVDTVTLSGVNIYTGATTISSGTLTIDATGSLAAGSAVSVNNTGFLAGTGAANGSVTVNAGGTIVPGTDGTVGTLTVGSLSFNGGTYKADILGDTSDTITTAGCVDLGRPPFKASSRSHGQVGTTPDRRSRVHIDQQHTCQ